MHKLELNCCLVANTFHFYVQQKLKIKEPHHTIILRFKFCAFSNFVISTTTTTFLMQGIFHFHKINKVSNTYYKSTTMSQT